MWPKTTLLPVQPGDAKRLDTPGTVSVFLPKAIEVLSVTVFWGWLGDM